MAKWNDEQRVSTYLTAPELVHATSVGEIVCGTGITCLNDEVFVSEHWKPELKVFSIATFTLLRLLPIPGLVAPTDLVSQNNSIYVADWQGNCVFHVELPGTVTRWPLDAQPESLSLTKQGNIIVSFYSSHVKPKEYTPDGQFVRELSIPGDITHNLHTVELASNLYLVVDGGPAGCIANMYARLLIVDPAGQIVKSCGSRDGPGEPVNQPNHVVEDKQGNILVTETGGNRVLLFSSSLACSRELIPREYGLTGPYRIYLEETRGLLFIAESTTVDKSRMLVYRVQQN